MNIPSLHSWLNRLVDGEMPALSDTELRVMLVVLRQTGGRGKERDWLARSQLVARTGRSPDAVSRAVNSLVRRRMLTVEDASGRERDTPDARRAARTALFYRVGNKLLSTASLPRGAFHDTTVSSDVCSVVSHDKTLAARSGGGNAPLGHAPSWADELAAPSSEERERIEIEKDRIRQRLRRAR